MYTATSRVNSSNALCVEMCSQFASVSGGNSGGVEAAVLQ